MTFTELQTEFFARGFSYLSDTAGLVRAKAFLNAGYRNLCESEPWPFLETTTSGTAPLTIADLRDIVYVATTNGELPLRDVSVFLGDDPLLAQTGTARYAWLDGQTSLKVWPLDTTTSLTVRYLKVPADLSGGTDVPIVPARYHSLIVEFAVIQALRDKSNYTEATAVRQGIEEDLGRMREALLNEADWFQATEGSNA